jgi:hypothetical protein
MSSGGRLIVSAHAGLADTRSLPGIGAGGGAGRSRSDMQPEGVLRMTWLLADVQPGDGGYTTDGSAFAVSITCDKPFSLLSATSGRIGFLLDHNNQAGGVGADAFLVGTIGVQDTASVNLPAPRVRAASDAIGSQAGRVVVRTPTGDIQWLQQPNDAFDANRLDNFRALEGGAGTYGATVDRAGASIVDVFWVAAWDLDRPFDLIQGQSPQSVIQS